MMMLHLPSLCVCSVVRVRRAVGVEAGSDGVILARTGAGARIDSPSYSVFSYKGVYSTPSVCIM